MDKIRSAAAALQFEFSDAELEAFALFTAPLAGDYVLVESPPDPRLPVKYPRAPGKRPPVEESPLNAWD